MVATQVAVASRYESAVPGGGTSVVHRGFDPFQLMDRLDEELIIKELEGIVADELAYKIVDKRTGKEEWGLSKAGVDEACRAMAQQGEVIREEKLEYEVDRERGEAFFRVTAGRYAVGRDGQEVRLDTAIGVKRQEMYFEGQALSLDSPCPFRKHKGKPWREVLETDRGYVEWVAGNANEEEMRVFAEAILAGEEPVLEARRPNPHWFEHGSMKAARNARYRLIRAELKARILAMAKETRRVREVEVGAEAGTRTPAPEPNPQPASHGRGRKPSDDGPVDPDVLAEIERLSASSAVDLDRAERIRMRLDAGDLGREEAARVLRYLRRVVAEAEEGVAEAGDDSLAAKRRRYFARIGALGWSTERRKAFQASVGVESVGQATEEQLDRLLAALEKQVPAD